MRGFEFWRWLAFVGEVPRIGFFGSLGGVFTCNVRRIVYTLRKKYTPLQRGKQIAQYFITQFSQSITQTTKGKIILRVLTPTFIKF